MAAPWFLVTVWFSLVIWSLLRTSGSTIPSQSHNISESAESKIERLGQTFKRNVRLLRERAGRLELVFLVDESSSVGATNFRNELHFVRKMLSDFPVASEATRVALITFSSKNHVLTRVDYISAPKAHQHKCALFNKEIPAITYRGGGTYTRGAFQRAAVSVWTCSMCVYNQIRRPGMSLKHPEILRYACRKKETDKTKKPLSTPSRLQYNMYRG
ncbi:sushi, von Willebrand factor type A, EGF and pentraxin domain-containing protein 1 isoform X1 [Tachysurus ichikawai]